MRNTNLLLIRLNRAVDCSNSKYLSEKALSIILFDNLIETRLHYLLTNKMFIKNMEIKVLGTGCATCKALFAAVEQVVAEMGIDATVTKEEDLMKIMEYNVMTLPALVVDGKVVAKGKLSAADIKNLLSK